MAKLTYNRIKELLAKKHKRNVELAEYMKMDPRNISSWCNNHSQPEFSNLFKIAEFLDVEAGELLTLKKDLIIVEEKKANKSKTKKRNSQKK